MFQAIDTNFLTSTAINSANKAGLELTWSNTYKGVMTATYGDTIVGPDGSKLKPMLFLRNINDGGHALMIGVGLYRSVCMNGLTVGDDLFSRRIIHRKGTTLDNFLANLEKDLTDAFHIAADTYMDKLINLHDTEITDNQAIQIIGSLNLSDNIKYYAIYSWLKPRIEDSKRSLLSLYNIVNEQNRRKSNSTAAFDRELSLLQHIEALHEHELIISAA